MYQNSEHHHENLKNARIKAHEKFPCKYCSVLRGKSNLSKHENTCYLNPTIIKHCIVCNNVLKNKNTVTCGYACSNTHHRTGENSGNYKGTSYRSICFKHHLKSCIICGETKIVAVHHLDENHLNDDPANLIPMCPTHHQYWHSKYKYLIIDKVTNYIDNWKLK